MQTHELDSPSVESKTPLYTRFYILVSDSGPIITRQVENFLQRYPTWRVASAAPLFNESGTFTKHMVYLTSDMPGNTEGPYKGEDFN